MQRWGKVSVVAAVIAALVIVAFVDSPREKPSGASNTHKTTPRGPDVVDVKHLVDVDEELPTADATDADAPEDASPPANKRARLRAFAQKNPADVLEVLVLNGGKPLGEVRVRMRAAEHGEMYESLEPGEDDRIAFTDGAGLARFDKVAPAHYMIGVETRDSALFTTYQFVRPGKQTSRQIIELGNGSVEGRIWDREGRVIADTRVMVTLWDPPSGATRLFAMTRTGANGSYVVGNLPRGKGRVYCELQRCIDFAIKDGQIARADFGSGDPPVVWSGCLRLQSGAIFNGFDNVVASDSIDGEGYAIALDEHARFTTRLPPGEYRVWAPGDPPLELGNAVLQGKELALDLVVPGTCVAGCLKYVGARNDGDAQRKVELTLQRVGDDASRRTREVGLGERYLFAGLDSGKWLISTKPLPLLGAGAKGLEVTLDGARERVALDLIVTDP